MRKEPINRISVKGLRVWRIYGIIQTLIVLLLGIGTGVINYFTGNYIWLYIVAGAVVLLFGYLFIYLFPKVRWSRWRYEVRDQEIELQHGLFVVKRTLVPMVRVQHVDTEQGPILRKYDLSSITISTAATSHTIPALITEEADELRGRISVLARVAEEDV
ncbi:MULTISPECIES: PH domain-containing protein [unclassified Psychrobacillus]|uniref:PH domain-containing protein n=1 Tax=unclassified Psychrobacillus TaxID=2636677 RepID=UPI00146D49A9|nr:PH domain-containing protein [Psychrobacillus sp. BL-248-WT-3]NME07269.1 PH domain-containing protein [Psychrobacillus sp. BL-248-WT-3]